MKIITTQSFDETTLLHYAVSIAQASEHPLAQSIVEYAKKQPIKQGKLIVTKRVSLLNLFLLMLIRWQV